MNKTTVRQSLLLSLVFASVSSQAPLLKAQGNVTYDNVQVNEDLTVDGNTSGDIAAFNEVQAGSIVVDDLKIYSSTIELGTFVGHPDWSLATMNVHESGGTIFMNWQSGLWGGDWTWSSQSPYGGYRNRMRLHADGPLQLLEEQGLTYDDVVTISLNPYGASSFTYNINLNGTDNQMPNQTLTGDGSILTRGLADARYAPISLANVFLDQDPTPGTDSLVFGTGSSVAATYPGVAVGTGATTEDGHSFAIGNEVTAKGWNNVAIGIHNWTDGFAAQSFGNYSVSNAYSSQAFGFSTWANGNNSATFNQSTITRAIRSSAFGYYTEATAANAFVLGRLNILDDEVDDWNWQYNEELFVIGNGEFTNASGVPSVGALDPTDSYIDNTSYISEFEVRPYARRSNALVVYKDGRMDVIAHASAPAISHIFSVKDGSINPAAPVTIMSVDKAGYIYGRGLYGSEYVESEFLYAEEYLYARILHGEKIVAGNNDYETDHNIIGDNALDEGESIDFEQPSLVVGGGSSGGQYANTMVARKGGDVDVSGALRVPPAGDLSMGSFTAGRDPRAALDPDGILESAGWGVTP